MAKKLPHSAVKDLSSKYFETEATDHEGYQAFDDISMLTSFRSPIQGSSTSEIAPEDADILLPNGTHVGDFQIEGVLGQGGMGTVYAAIHPLIGKKVAIKVLRKIHFHDSRSLESFVQEARSVNQISHENIVDIFTFGLLDDGRAYLIMEWLEGKTLGHRLRKGKIPFEEALQIVDEMCSAVKAAHAKGIIHRDLKPENVYLKDLSRGGFTIKLLDFGIAKKTNDGLVKDSTSLETNALVGTPAYVAPEQARGKGMSDKTDIYSLGCIVFEIFTGQKPFYAESAVEMVSRHLYETAPDPTKLNPSLPRFLGIIIQEMMAKDMNARPNIQDVYDVLAQFRDNANDVPSGIKTSQIKILEPASTPPKKSQPIWPTLAFGLLCVVGTFAFMKSTTKTLSEENASLTFNGDSSNTNKIVTPPLPDAQVKNFPLTTPSSAWLQNNESHQNARLQLKISPKQAKVVINGSPHDVIDGQVNYSGAPSSEAHVLVLSDEHQSKEKTFRLGDMGTIKEFRFHLSKESSVKSKNTKKKLK